MTDTITLPRTVVEQVLEAFTRGCPPDCKDGMTDSGGVYPWGEAALIPCPACQAFKELRAALEQVQEASYFIAAPECIERGCSAHDPRVDGPGVRVVVYQGEQT